jgi:chromosome segregation ATPase
MNQKQSRYLIRSYRRRRKFVQKQRRKEAGRTKPKKRRQSILALIPMASYIGTNIWLGKKKLTLFTVIWLASMFGYNFSTHSSKKQTQIYQQEINRLHKYSEELPELISRVLTQEIELQESAKKLQETEDLGKEFRVQSSTLKEDLEKVNQKLLHKNKKEEVKLTKILTRKDQKLDNLEQRIRELTFESAKDNLAIKNYKKDIKSSEDKFRQGLETVQKANEESKDSKKQFEITKFRLKLVEDTLNQKLEQLIQEEADVKNSKIREITALELVEDLEEKLKEKETELLDSTKQILELGKKCKNLQEELEDIKKEQKWLWAISSLQTIFKFKGKRFL